MKGFSGTGGRSSLLLAVPLNCFLAFITIHLVMGSFRDTFGQTFGLIRAWRHYDIAYFIFLFPRRLG